MGFAISTATWLTLLGQWLFHHEQQIPFGLGFPVLMLWVIVMVSPTHLLAYAVGWEWGDVGPLRTFQLIAVLLVNALLWGAVGMIPALVLKSRVAAKRGSKTCFIVGGIIFVIGYIVNDGRWLRNIGLFVLLIGGAIPVIYSVWAKRGLRSPIDADGRMVATPMLSGARVFAWLDAQLSGAMRIASSRFFRWCMVSAFCALVSFVLWRSGTGLHGEHRFVLWLSLIGIGLVSAWRALLYRRTSGQGWMSGGLGMFHVLSFLLLLFLLKSV
jgi:hypothetical protein